MSTEPRTAAGRELLEEFWPERDDEFGLRESVAHTILAIEREAAERASGGLNGVHASVMEAMSRIAESKVDASDDEYKRGWIDALGAISGELARLMGGQDR